LLRDKRGEGMGCEPDRGAEAPFYARRLRPHRSLTGGGRRRVLAAFALLQTPPALAFSLQGAWPAGVFLVLTWAGLAFAFARNARAAAAYEDVEIGAWDMRYARVSASGARRDWRFNPLWVRLGIERHPEFGVERLDLMERRRRLEVGAFLGRGEKTRLAAELDAALAQARRGHRFDG
jgi:uncharacterized membrane protein